MGVDSLVVSSDTSVTTSASPAGQVQTFLIADVRGYTRFTRDHGDEAAAGLALRFADVARVVVSEWDGEVLGLRGDELAAAFGSPRQALQAAIALQQRFADELRADPALPLLVGIGLDAGESIAVEDGYRGGALNLAARLCSLAKAGEVLVTDTVEHLAGRQQGVTFVDAGRHRVKGLVERVHVFRAVFPLDMPELPTPRSAPRALTRVAAIALVGFVVLLAAVAWVTTRGGSPAAVGVVVRANSLVKIDVKSHRVVGDVPLGAEPGKVVSGGGYLWVAEEQRESVVRVDPKTLNAIPDGMGIDPSELAYGDGSLWAYDPLGGLAAQVDPNLEQDPTPTLFSLPPCPNTRGGIGGAPCGPGGGIAASQGSVWFGRMVSDAIKLGVVWQVDPNASPTPTVTRTLTNVPAGQFAFGAGSIWTSGWFYVPFAAQIDAASGKLIKRWVVPGGGAGFQNPGLTYAYGYAWLVSLNGDLLQLASARNEVGSSGFQKSVHLSPGSQNITAGGTYLWVTNNAGTLTQINPRTVTVIKTYRLGHPAYGVAYTPNNVWVTVTSP